MNNKMTYDIQLTPNFKLSEFINSSVAKKKKIKEQYNITLDIVKNIYELTTTILQPLRNEIGQIIISSGYRCYQLNVKVGGVDNSQHLVGSAADIKVSNINQAVEILKKMEFDQLVIYPTFIHISYKNTRFRKQIIDRRI